MISFVTWPPFCNKIIIKVTYVLVKIYYKLFYIIQEVENSFGKVTIFLASADIRVFGRTCLHVCIVASDWPHIFLRSRCFCLAYNFTSNTRKTLNFGCSNFKGIDYYASNFFQNARILVLIIMLKVILK